MMSKLKEIKEEIKKLEGQLNDFDFWQDKERAQDVLKRLRDLKESLGRLEKYDKGEAVMSIYAGAGGDDAEDWVRILFEMYQKFALKKGWNLKILHIHKNEKGGMKNITFEILGKGAYGELKNESGVHRLVRNSPFSAKKLRHTSFALVEVLPKFIENVEVEINPGDLEIEFSKSSGPGGQNVNKRETAVRIIHKPTGISVRVDSERSQLQNRERAIELLRSRLYNLYQKYRKEELENLKLTKGVEAEWGHQIRSYVFHPYKMVKDHRTGLETNDVEGVLEGDLEKFIEAERNI